MSVYIETHNAYDRAYERYLEQKINPSAEIKPYDPEVEAIADGCTTAFLVNWDDQLNPDFKNTIELFSEIIKESDSLSHYNEGVWYMDEETFNKVKDHVPSLIKKGPMPLSKWEELLK